MDRLKLTYNLCKCEDCYFKISWRSSFVSPAQSYRQPEYDHSKRL